MKMMVEVACRWKMGCCRLKRKTKCVCAKTMRMMMIELMTTRAAVVTMAVLTTWTTTTTKPP